jgi:hypothetical protein
LVALLAPPALSNGWLGTLAWSLLELTPVAGIPAAVTVAVLKYRLYEIDKIISRTVAYAIVTGLLVGVYAGLVLLAQQVLRFSSPVAVAAFAARLKEAVDQDAVRSDLLSVVQRSLEPVHATVWIRTRP